MTADAVDPRASLGSDRVEARLELALTLLGLVWLALLVVELVASLPTWLEHVATAIWGVFLADFVVRLAMAPERAAYLRHNWLTIIALLVPALRVLRVARLVRVLRAARAVRGVRALRIMTTFGRAKRSIHTLLARRHAFGYVIGLTVAIAFLGAAGMFAFERGGDAGFEGYPHALWWTTMLLMTLGTDAWPKTAEGRILALVLALYGFAMFGYITASIATWLLGREKLARDAREGS